jgi:hypothetical protein
MAPLALVARARVLSFPLAIYEQKVSYLQTARTITVPCSRKMILPGLFNGREDNIHV